MPQTSPMNWFIILMIINYLFILMMMMNFNYNLVNSKMLIKLSKINWKW